MRITVQEVSLAVPAFKPLSVTITLETLEEYQAVKAVGQANIRVPDMVSQNYSNPGPMSSVIHRFCTQLFAALQSR